jgi:beta-mannosidase
MTWTVRAVGGPVPDALAGVAVPATVPGCVHLDLLAAGAIPDPYHETNEAALAWIGRVSWRYESTVDWRGSPGEQVDLVAYGLDTVATVELNGHEVARTANMHRTYRFPVAGLLRPGPNTLAVTFAAPVDAALAASAALGQRPHVNAHPYNAIRKMACNYGWDWGPDLATVGIWRPLVLERWRGVRIAAVRPLVEVSGGTGWVRTHVDLERAPGHTAPVEVRVAVGAASTTVSVGGSTAVVPVAVPDAALWWPRGHGAQPLYEVRVSAAGAEWSGRVGFRTVALDIGGDERGTRFTLSVNGRPLFARGVNWIPDDCFPTRVSPQRYAERLTQAAEAGVNLVRVWGGGIYESEDFYRTCDELGLLVWQDFPFACAAYAEEEPLRGEVIAEARQAVTRLSQHPSLALWNGGNECVWGYHDWGWPERLAGRSWGLGYYTGVLPRIVAELDPTRPYSPGSPYSFAAGRHPNDPDHGTMHIWDVWNERDYTGYRRYVPRFAAEFGFQGPATWSTLTEAAALPDSPALAAHQKAADGAGKLARGLAGHLPQPNGAADWHWATSLNQARAVALGVEHLRSWWPVCAGAVVWQLNDTWPAVSWSAIDSGGRRKPLWYALRRAYRDRLLTLQPRDGELALVAVNDSAQPWQGSAALTRRDLDGTVLAAADLPFLVPARAALPLPVPATLAAPGDARREVLLAQCGADRSWWHFAEDVAADLPPHQVSTSVRAVPGGYRVTVTAAAFVRDLALLADRAAPDAEVDDMLHTLLPGESTEFTVRTSARLTPDQLTGPLVLRSANQLVHAAP